MSPEAGTSKPTETNRSIDRSGPFETSLLLTIILTLLLALLTHALGNSRNADDIAVLIAEPTFAVGGEARLEELVGVARNELTNKVAAVGVKLTDLVAGEAFEEASLSLAGA
jgi:hypothetical protein